MWARAIIFHGILYRMIYLDNNATTYMSTATQNAMVSWCNKGNPSAGYSSAVEARAMMDAFKIYLGNLCQCGPTFTFIFTSGASEANSTILAGVTNSYAQVRRQVPHVVMSAIEHKSLIDMARDLEKRGRITATYVSPTISGHILARDVSRAILPNTCLVCVMHANNETGAINDVAAIGAAAHAKGVPYHCDTVQTFGKYPLDPESNNVDSFCVSFHKFGGPPGVGVLVVRNKFLHGYNIAPLIYGSQNNTLRGGTENLPGIGASFAACKIAMADREAKNTRMEQLKARTMAGLSQNFRVVSYSAYVNGDQPVPTARDTPIIVVLAAVREIYLPNTLLISVVRQGPPYVCNGDIKAALEKKNVIVSVGSACNTASKTASHVLFAMGADDLVRKGALRITFGDDNVGDDADIFVRELAFIVSRHH